MCIRAAFLAFHADLLVAYVWRASSSNVLVHFGLLTFLLGLGVRCLYHWSSNGRAEVA
jgi:hypothetical protein